MMTIVPRLVFVYVQVTVSPAARLMLAMPVAVLPDELLVGSTQTRLVRSQPVRVVSVTLYVPGSTLLIVSVVDSVGSASSSRLNDVWPVTFDVNAKSCASLGTASFTMTIVPRLVF